MLRKILFLAVTTIALALIPVLGDNCPTQDSECPGGPCVTKILCEDFETTTLDLGAGRIAYDYGKNQVATLDTQSIAFQGNQLGGDDKNRQWRTDNFAGVFASQPGTIGLAHEPPYTTEFNPSFLTTVCPTTVTPAPTGLRRACSRTVKAFQLTTANFFRITGVTRFRRETTGTMPSKVAWFNQQFVATSATDTYFLSGTLRSIQTSSPPVVCICPEYQKNTQPASRPPTNVCIFADQVDPANTFVKLVTAIDLKTTNQVKIQVELRDMNNMLLSGCFVPDPCCSQSACKANFIVPLASADYQALLLGTTATVARLYPVVCNDAAQPRVVEIDRVSVAETTAFEFPF